MVKKNKGKITNQNQAQTVSTNQNKSTLVGQSSTNNQNKTSATESEKINKENKIPEPLINNKAKNIIEVEKEDTECGTSEDTIVENVPLVNDNIHNTGSVTSSTPPILINKADVKMENTVSSSSFKDFDPTKVAEFVPKNAPISSLNIEAPEFVPASAAPAPIAYAANIMPPSHGYAATPNVSSFVRPFNIAPPFYTQIPMQQHYNQYAIPQGYSQSLMKPGQSQRPYENYTDTNNRLKAGTIKTVIHTSATPHVGIISDNHFPSGSDSSSGSYGVEDFVQLQHLSNITSPQQPSVYMNQSADQMPHQNYRMPHIQHMQHQPIVSAEQGVPKDRVMKQNNEHYSNKNSSKPKRILQSQAQVQQQSQVQSSNIHSQQEILTATPAQPQTALEKNRKSPSPIAELKIPSVQKIDEQEGEEVLVDGIVPSKAQELNSIATDESFKSGADIIPPGQNKTFINIVEKQLENIEEKENIIIKKESKSIDTINVETERENIIVDIKTTSENQEENESVLPVPLELQTPIANFKVEDTKSVSNSKLNESSAALKENDPIVPAKGLQNPMAGFNFADSLTFSNIKINEAERSKIKSIQIQKVKQAAEKAEEESNDPNNRKYSRDKLMKLRAVPKSQIPPADLDKTSVIFRNENYSGSNSGSMTFNTYKNFNNFSRSSMSSSSYKEKEHAPMIIHSVSLRDEVKLKTVENAWKPTQAKKDPNDIVLTEARSLLNKLSPENFDSILVKFCALKYNKDNIDKIIDIIFFKAVWEPKFAEVYAKFIDRMIQADAEKNAKQKNNSEGGKKKSNDIDFRFKIMKKCQSEFEQISAKDKDSKNKMMSLKNIADEKERNEAKLKYEEEERLGRKRSVGLVTFIGELFKLKLLSVKILHICCKQLLASGNDIENLECLAKLITSTGKICEEINANAGGTKSWDEIIAEVRKLVSNSNKDRIPSRIRFMILDVLDLRARGWIPRMVENKPKTMAQIEKDIDNEALSKSIQIKDDDRNMGRDISGGNRFNKKPTNQPQNTNQNVQHNQAISVNTNKLLVVKEEHISLGPSSSAHSWGQGAGAKKDGKQAMNTGFTMPKNSATPRKISTSTTPTPFVQQNSFDALSNSNETPSSYTAPNSKNKSTPQRQTSKVKVVEQQHLEISKTTPTEENVNNIETLEKELFDESLIESGSKFDNFYISDKYLELLQFGYYFKEVEEFRSKYNVYSDEIADSMAKCLNNVRRPLNTVKKYFKECEQCIDVIKKELKSDNETLDPEQFIKSLLFPMVNITSRDKHFIISLLISIIDTKKMSKYIIKDFIIYILKKDIEDEHRGIWKDIGQVIGYLIVFKNLTFDDYKQHFVNILKYMPRKANSIFVATLQAINQSKGLDYVLSEIKSEDEFKQFISPLVYKKFTSVNTFEDNPDYTTFIEENNLEFLVKNNIKLLTNIKGSKHKFYYEEEKNLDVIHMSLHYYISNFDSSVNIIDYINVNFGVDCDNSDIYYTITQYICTECDDVDKSGDEKEEKKKDNVNSKLYKFDEKKFESLMNNIVLEYIKQSSRPEDLIKNISACLYSLLDINLYLKLPRCGTILGQQLALLRDLFDIESSDQDESLSSASLLYKVEAVYRDFNKDVNEYYKPVNAKFVKELTARLEPGYSKSTALVNLNSFFKSLNDELDDSK